MGRESSRRAELGRLCSLSFCRTKVGGYRKFATAMLTIKKSRFQDRADPTHSKTAPDGSLALKATANVGNGLPFNRCPSQTAPARTPRPSLPG